MRKFFSNLFKRKDKTVYLAKDSDNSHVSQDISMPQEQDVSSVRIDPKRHPQIRRIQSKTIKRVESKTIKRVESGPNSHRSYNRERTSSESLTVSELKLTEKERSQNKKICIFFCDDAKVVAKTGFRKILSYFEKANFLDNDAIRRAFEIDKATGYGVFEENNILVVVAKDGKIMFDHYQKYDKEHNEIEIETVSMIISDYEMSTSKVKDGMPEKEKKEMLQKIYSEDGVCLIKNIIDFHKENPDKTPEMMIMTANPLSDLNNAGLNDDECRTASKVNPGPTIQLFLNDMLHRKHGIVHDISEIIKGSSAGSITVDSPASVSVVPINKETRKLSVESAEIQFN